MRVPVLVVRWSRWCPAPARASRGAGPSLLAAHGAITPRRPATLCFETIAGKLAPDVGTRCVARRGNTMRRIGLAMPLFVFLYHRPYRVTVSAPWGRVMEGSRSGAAASQFQASQQVATI